MGEMKQDQPVNLRGKKECVRRKGTCQFKDQTNVSDEKGPVNLKTRTMCQTKRDMSIYLTSKIMCVRPVNLNANKLCQTKRSSHSNSL